MGGVLDEPLPRITAARIALAVCGLGWLVFGPAAGAVYGLPGFLDPLSGPLVGFVLWVPVLLLFVVFGFALGVLNLAVAWGLGRREPWAWYAGLALGVLYTPTGCLPVGLVLLYALLDAQARRVFLGVPVLATGDE